MGEKKRKTKSENKDLSPLSVTNQGMTKGSLTEATVPPVEDGLIVVKGAVGGVVG